MKASELGRSRRRLTASYAAVALVVLAVLAVVAILQAGDRRHQQQDRLVESTALLASGYAYPQGSPSHIEIDRRPAGYFGADRRPGAPVGVVDPAGRLLAGPPGLLDPQTSRRAFALIRNGLGPRLTTTESDGRQVRLAANPIPGTQGVLGAIVAVQPLAVARAQINDTALRIGAGALGLWLLMVAASWFLTGRALRPAAATVRREEAFLADAAHELRTPVAVIRARAEQALRTPGAPAGEALEAIGRAAQRASNTIADMLDLARLDARRDRLEREPLRLDLLLEQVVAEHEEAARGAGVELRLASGSEAVVLGDERLLARSIANLVENAIRYGADGGAVDVGVTVDQSEALVEVRDRGPGVPPAQRAAIFDRFHRATGTGGGSGLGLSISRLVAEAHDGRLELLPSADEPGAAFVLRLPLA
ncbi:MAG: HAMP domain-containing histidine kinase [Actinobacteria bacterium]|nr:HAMP domain-containing histidine kinase [Actinomycetota bacterium]